MRRHAKASSSGSSTRQGSSSGRVIRGALATRATSSRAGGSGASSARLLLGAVAVLALTLALGVGVASALAPTVTFDNATPAYTTATVRGTINPQGHPVTYRFQYATAPDFSDAVTGAQGALAGEHNSRQVEAVLSGLQTQTTYYLRLIAENADGQSEAVAASSIETLAPDSPLVDKTDVSGVGGTEATLTAKVNPRGAATTYHFQYIDEAGYEASEFTNATSTPNQPLNGVANPTLLATAGISGLEPGATYYYRVLASNSKGSIEGPAKAFHTYASASEEPDSCPNANRRAEQQSTTLPNCRAYEMVSPIDKNGGDVRIESTRTFVAEDGDAVIFPSYSGFADANGIQIDTEYRSQRTAAPGTQGWTTHGIAPAQEALSLQATAFGVATNFEAAFTPDLSAGVYRAWRPLTEAPNVSDVANLYRIDGLAGGTAGTTLLSDSTVPVTPQALVPFFGPNLLFYHRPIVMGASTDLSHVAFVSNWRLTDDAPGEENPFGIVNEKLYEYSDGAVHYVGILPNGDPAEISTATIAGNALTYTYPMPHAVSADGSHIFFSDLGAGNVYVRIDGSETVQLNASEKATPESPAPARLWDASADGSRAFFITSEGLVEGDDDGAPSLYMYDETAPAGSRLTVLSPPGAYVDGVVGASDDGRYVYFVAGGLSLYVWHDGAVMSIGGFSFGGVAASNFPSGRYTGASETQHARLTPDGRHLLFMSTGDASLKGHGGFAGYDHGDCDGFGCEELYLYSADSGQLRCVSCNPSGAAASENALPYGQVGFGALTPQLSQALSDDGRYAFFNTREALIPEDTNGAVDAYESDSETGELHLLSSGADSGDSYFLDASPDGSDVFIATRESLAGWDRDNNYDIYDVRVGGGFPDPPPVPAACEGDSCRPALEPAPGVSPVGSGQAGPGNPAVKCPKGRHAKKANGKSRCVRNTHKHNKRKRNANDNRRAGR